MFKRLKYLLFLMFFLFGNSINSAEPKEEVTYLETLPEEIRYHLFSFIMTGKDPQEAATNIITFLSANKELNHYLNNKQFMIELIMKLMQRYNISSFTTAAKFFGKHGLRAIDDNSVRNTFSRIVADKKKTQEEKINQLNYFKDIQINPKKFTPFLAEVTDSQQLRLIQWLLERGINPNDGNPADNKNLPFSLSLKIAVQKYNDLQSRIKQSTIPDVKKELKSELKNSKAIIKLLLKYGAIADEQTKKLLKLIK